MPRMAGHNLMEPARPRCRTHSYPTGRMAGSFTHRELATFTSARACCCQPCPRPPVPVRSPSGLHAGAWLTAVPADPACTLAPQSMQVALRRRLRLPLPLCSGRCVPDPGCGRRVDALGDHALACPRTRLLARRAKVLERAWVRVAREAVGPEGQVVPQQWFAHITAPQVDALDRLG